VKVFTNLRELNKVPGARCIPPQANDGAVKELLTLVPSD
jgi:hypothetical protein